MRNKYQTPAFYVLLPKTGQCAWHYKDSLQNRKKLYR